MARLSRLLSAISLGAAVTAALGAAVVAVEYNPVHKSPTHLPESVAAGRVIVKFRERSSILSTSTSAASASTAAGPQKASVMSARLGVALSDGRALGARTQVMTSTGMSSSALVAALNADSDVEWAQVDRRRFAQAAAVNDLLYPDGQSIDAPQSGQWYLRAAYSETVPVMGANGQITPTVENVVSGINIEPAWAITHGSSSIVIGDVDTGITQHPDLDSKMLTGYDFIGWGASNRIYGLGLANSSDAIATANDGNLADPDPSDPGDYVTAAENSNSSGPFYKCNDADFPDDPPGSAVAVNSSWHGTQTASILGAATNNGAGMAGTGYDTPVIAARALGKCGGYDSDIIAAALWSGGIAVANVPANAHPARVINMSLGSSGNCATDAPAYVDAFTALRNKGVIVVAAAGNDEGLSVAVPANCQPATSDTNKTPLVIAVAGLRHAGTKVGFSDIGPEVTIAAPGGNCVNTNVTAATPCLYPIITAINSGATAPVANGGIYSDGVNHISLGTSFATPMVAGTVALMLSAAPNLTNQQVIDILKSTARPFPTVSDTTPQPPVCTVPASGSTTTQDECICTTSTCGAGMLDAGRAVIAAAALSTGSAPTYTAPTAVVAPAGGSVVAGSTLTLSGATSVVGSSGTALTYQWSIPDGDGFVSLGSTTGASVVVTGVSAGTGEVRLTVTDPTSGLTNSTTVSITVTAASTGGGSTGGGGGGGGGGGAANPAWLLALALAGLLLRPRARRPRA
ncbi:S8 family serine peptidase [Scleromatobacter humisilvae]|uniref:S8 family serine peptidase n=1 Tax=Scleromatobacter humisilvae TaxID=2897159 RepID=A0A9X1YPR5_9BURK|nr:S8 family serine peptidase [Scleromatobacter humisilvae]MCK9689580.1 S8 family serine peptidase [Scleromatobacter humisilvae]